MMTAYFARHRALTAALAAIIVAVIPLLLRLNHTPIAPSAALPLTALPSKPPSAPASPTPRPGRTVSVPGVDLPVDQVSFVDGRHGWAHLSGCEHGKCAHAIAFTADAGQSWQRAALPDGLSPRTSLYMFPLDSRTLVLYVLQNRDDADPVRSFLSTRDSGRTFQSYPYSSPPPEASLAAPDGQRGSRYRVRCAGANGYEDGANGSSCPVHELIADGKIVRPRSPLLQRYGAGQISEGSDGRIWLLCQDESQAEAAVSRDGGKSWTELPPIKQLNVGLVLSPDGREAWYVTKSGMYSLANGQWVAQPGHPAGYLLTSVVPLADARAMVAYGETVGELRKGVYTPYGIKGSSIAVLSDATYAVTGEGFMYLGTPAQWNLITWR